MRTCYILLLAGALAASARADDFPRDPAGHDTNSAAFVIASVNDSIRLNEIQRAAGLATEKGRGVLAFLLAQPGYAPFDVRVTGQSIADDGELYRHRVATTCICDGQPADGPFEFEYRLRFENGQWLFDDIFVLTFCAHRIDLEVSYLRSHPFVADIQIMQRNAGATFGSLVAGIVGAIAQFPPDEPGTK